MENIDRKSALKTSAIPLFNFGKYHKTKQMHTRHTHIHTQTHTYIYIFIYIISLTPSLKMKFNPKVYDPIN